MILRSVALALVGAVCACSAAITPEEMRGLTENRTLLKGTITVVTFLSAKCPVSNAYGTRLQNIYVDYGRRGIRFLFVNSNQNEDEAEISRNAAGHGYTFAIFQDRGSVAADRFGAQATPEVFVLDRGARVVYHGAVDDAQNPARVHHQALREALDQLLQGAPVTVPEVKAFGCTIKRPRKIQP